MCSISYFCWCYQWLHLPWWSHFFFCIALSYSFCISLCLSLCLTIFTFFFFAFTRCYYPKWLTVHSCFSLHFISSRVPLESNPWTCVANAMLYCLICINAIYLSDCLEKWKIFCVYLKEVSSKDLSDQKYSKNNIIVKHNFTVQQYNFKCSILIHFQI